MKRFDHQCVPSPYPLRTLTSDWSRSFWTLSLLNKQHQLICLVKSMRKGKWISGLILRHSSFPLINWAFFRQIGSISSIWQIQSCMVIHRTGDCLRLRWHRNLSDLSGEHQTFKPRAWVQLPSKFWSVVKIFS